MNRYHGSNKDVSIRSHIALYTRYLVRLEYTDGIRFVGDDNKVKIRSEAPGV